MPVPASHRLQGRALSPRAGSQDSYLCAGTNFRNGCLFGTSMLINGRLGRQLSLVLSGIAKGRGAGFLLVVTRSAKMMADLPPLSQPEAASSPHECSAHPGASANSQLTSSRTTQ